MKKRIRLTESDLRRIVKESVKRIINEGWYSGKSDTTRFMASKDVMDDLLETITEEDVSSYEEWEKFANYCEQNPSVFEIDATLCSTYDETTGYGNRYQPVIELESISGDKEALDYVAKYPNRKVAEVAVQTLKGIFQNLSEDDFEDENDRDDFYRWED